MSNIVNLVTMANGANVYVDTKGSHAATHIKDNPELLNLVKVFLKNQSFHEENVAIEHDTGKIIGSMDLIDTDEKDEIVYAIRQNREIYTKFAKI